LIKTDNTELFTKSLLVFLGLATLSDIAQPSLDLKVLN